MDAVIQIGAPAPDFTLPDLYGGTHILRQARGRVIILNFWSAECPWSERADRELLAALPGWGDRVELWAIASNANESLELASQAAAARGLPFVLHDSQQQVAILYGAQTTPHLFVVDQAGILGYQGALDDVTFRRRTPTRHYVRNAVEAILEGQRPQPAQTSPYGCMLVKYPAQD